MKSEIIYISYKINALFTLYVTLYGINEQDFLFSANFLLNRLTTTPKLVKDVIFCERKEWIGIEERSSA